MRASARSRTVAAVLTVVAAAGCSGTDRGTVEGQYRLAGGPAPGLPRPQLGTIWAYAGKVSLADMRHAKPTRSTQTDRQGHYNLRLKPGEYTLLGALGVVGVSFEKNSCGLPVVIHVRPSQNSKVDLLCSVP